MRLLHPSGSQANPDAHIRRRRYHLMKRYGITLEQYQDMLDRQKGVCAICWEPPSRDVSPMGDKRAKLVVDHNHATGRIRALLCFDCNVKLSAIEDEQFMLLAKRYLRRTDNYVFTEDTYEN